jgi:uncharacterized membrane protein
MSDRLGATLAIMLLAACGPPDEMPRLEEGVGEATPARELRAFGNEPFWSVSISDREGIVLSRLGEDEVGFPYEDPNYPTEDTLTLVYGPAVDSSGAHEIEIVISREECQDTMVDRVHPMTATVTLDGETMTGCAGPAEATLGE